MRTLKCMATSKQCTNSCNKIKRIQKIVVPKVVSNALSLSIDDDILASIVSEFGSHVARNHKVIKYKPRLIVSSKLIKSLTISISLTMMNDLVFVREYDHWISHVIKFIMFML